jgi:hypothetical protein
MTQPDDGGSVGERRAVSRQRWWQPCQLGIENRTWFVGRNRSRQGFCMEQSGSEAGQVKQLICSDAPAGIVCPVESNNAIRWFM